MAVPRPPSLLAQPSYLASQVSKFGRRQLELALSDRGLALVHHAVLSALDDLGPLSQQQLADSLDLDKSHLVGRIDQLENRDLVKRTQDSSDRRRNQVTLTAAGRTLVDELQPVARQSSRGFSVRSPERNRGHVSLLQRVLASKDAARSE